MNGALADPPGSAQSTLNTTLTTPKDAGPDTTLARKRKRDSDSLAASDQSGINIRPCPGSIYDKPFLLRPLQIVSRACIPLSFLDTTTTSNSCFPGRLFTASIEALERENAEKSETRVLIAKVDGMDALYAIEQVKQRVYTLCRLYDWVQLSELNEGPCLAIEQGSRSAFKNAETKWWQKAVVEAPRATAELSLKRLKLNMAPPSKPAYAMPFPHIKPAIVGNSMPEESVLGEEVIPPPIDGPKSNEEMFDTLIRQYLDAIYISKTSLAFFAKGPLSRIRNAFLANTDLNAILNLTLHLRSMLLSMGAMDKKYKEKLPETIKRYPTQALSEDEVDKPLTCKKRRSKKVPKLSRDGCYAFEEEYFRRWWCNTKSNAARARPEETFEQLLRRRTGDLRRRETLAQITLILEILALEALPESNVNQVQPEESQTGETHGEQNLDSHTADTNNLDDPKKPKRKRKKQMDLDLHLDLLLDKLSIWQSIEQDIGAAINAEKKQDHLVENSEKLQEQDILVGFCTDVVIPFYKSRIPKQASQVNKKLGGPGAASPAKPESSRSRDAEKNSTRSGDRRPGRKPLQKTLSDTNGFIRSRPPSLSRSATDLQGIPRLKREASELSLLDIPLARPAHRDSMSQLRHLQQRQVDLTAISVATDAKLKQRAKIEQDLKEAINTLKRPNRGQAVRELVDAADQRSLGSASMRKKTMGPVRKVLQNVRNIQVTATPKHKRGFNAMAVAKVEHEEEMEEQHAPSSGDFCIPSSGIRNPNADLVGATPAVSRSKTLDGAFAISATPSKRSLQAVASEMSASGDIGATPVKRSVTMSKLKFDRPAHSSAQQDMSFQEFMSSQMARSTAPVTPLKKGLEEVTVAMSSIRAEAVFATPARPLSRPTLDAFAETTPLKATSAAAKLSPALEEQSIYDALGWNDYDDEMA